MHYTECAMAKSMLAFLNKTKLYISIYLLAYVFRKVASMHNSLCLLSVHVIQLQIQA